MNVQMEHTFGWHKDDIVDILSSGEEPIPIECMPIFQDYTLRDFRITGEGFSKKREWGVQGKIPDFAKKVIKPHMLRFDEETSWLNSNATSITELKPHFFKNKIRCIIVIAWDHDGESGTRRRVDINLKVRIPFIGKRLEKILAEILRQNNAKYVELLKSSFEKMIGKPCYDQKWEN